MSATPILDLQAPLPQRRPEILPRVIGFVVGVVGSLGALKLFYGDSAAPSDVLIFLLALAVAVVVHELGHLIAGWTVGFHFNSIQIRMVLYRVRVREANLQDEASVQLGRVCNRSD